MKSELNDNANKFYIVQVLKQKAINKYFTFTRYGRVGKDGSIIFKDETYEDAVEYFEK